MINTGQLQRDRDRSWGDTVLGRHGPEETRSCAASTLKRKTCKKVRKLESVSAVCSCSRVIEGGCECGEEGKKVLGWAGSGRLGPERSRRGGAEPRAYMQIEGEIRLIRTGNTAQNA